MAGLQRQVFEVSGWIGIMTTGGAHAD